MTELTSLTLGEARDGLRGGRFSAVELADAYLAAMEGARALNAYVLEMPDKARALGRTADGPLATREGRPPGGNPHGGKEPFAPADPRPPPSLRIPVEFA